MSDAVDLVLAIGRGRALAAATPLLSKIGLKVPEADGGRVLGHDIGQGIRLQILRNWDVPVYVCEGAADIGIVGNDVLAEHPNLDVYAPLDLGISRCRLAIAAAAGQVLPLRPRIATRHGVSTRKWFQEQGRSLHLLHLYGSLEVAPARGLVDGICDLVQTGRSLRAHQLEEVATVMEVSARLIINKASARLRMKSVNHLVQQFSQLTEAAEG